MTRWPLMMFKAGRSSGKGSLGPFGRDGAGPFAAAPCGARVGAGEASL
jgi:hypothetical protein